MDNMNESSDFTIKPCTKCNNYVPIDMSRIMRKLDILFDKKDFDEADSLFLYWLNEAEKSANMLAKLELHNKYMGFCRDLRRSENALNNADTAYRLLKELDLLNTMSDATVLLNIVTVYKAFSDKNVALHFFNKAKNIYDANLEPNVRLFAGLYNNMALALVDLKIFEEAIFYYKKAIEIMKKIDGSELDEAISYLNLADVYYAMYKNDESEDYTKYENIIQNHVETAWELLNKENLVRDEYYRFVCEKFYPSFSFYSYFVYANELKSRSVNYS